MIDCKYSGRDSTGSSVMGSDEKGVFVAVGARYIVPVLAGVKVFVGRRVDAMVGVRVIVRVALGLDVGLGVRVGVAVAVADGARVRVDGKVGWLVGSRVEDGLAVAPLQPLSRRPTRSRPVARKPALINGERVAICR